MTALAAGPLGAGAPDYRRFELPWTRIEEEARRFRNALLGVMSVLLALSVIIPFLPASNVRQHAAQDIPPRLAKFVLEKKIVPPPPAPPVEIQPEPVTEPVPVVAEKPRIKPPPVVRNEPDKSALVESAPTPAPTPAPTIEQARNRAKSVGLLAAADNLASLRHNAAVAQTTGQSLSAAVGNAHKTERALVTSRSAKRSAGVNTANLSRNTGGGGLASRATTAVTSPAAVATIDRSSGAAATTAYAGQRSQEEIETIFDRNKTAIYALYRRALRQDPSLQGKLVLQLTIAPSGKVVSCSILSSELNAPEFEENLVKRVRMFDFGAQDVDEVTTTKPIDFFPA
ncbi:MAG: TonB family protein [Gammaproteobacteria bacterium]|nr:TonB family protein [Gammaproteobacteria bacterium]